MKEVTFFVIVTGFFYSSLAQSNCSDGDIRLAGINSNIYQGRVELCYSKAWGTVCDDIWNTNNANVVCRQLGFFPTGNTALSFATFGQGTGPIFLDNVHCNGDESSLLGCAHNGIGRHNCGHHEDASVICAKFEFYPFGVEFGDTKLPPCDDCSFSIPFSFLFAGVIYDNVYISTNGIISLGNRYTTFTPTNFPFSPQHLIAPFWMDLDTRQNGSIFYRFFNDSTSADSAINEYNNYTSPVYISTSSLLVTWDRLPLFSSTIRTGTFQVYLTTDRNKSYAFFIYNNQTYPRGAVVGINVGDGINFDLQASTTAGNSDTIAQRTNVEVFGRQGLYFYRIDNLPNAFHCANNGEIRLVGRDSGVYQGRVELCYNNEWGTICDDFWDSNEANVVCKQLGFFSAGNIPIGLATFGQGIGPIALGNVHCNGSESSLLDCTGTYGPSCGHYEDAGVMCAKIEFYPFGMEFEDMELSLNEHSSFDVPFSFPFAGVTYDTAYINTNGIISLGFGYPVATPSDFPFISQPLIAPFWQDHDTGYIQTIYYRFLDDRRSADSAINAYNNFSLPEFFSTSGVLVTYDRVQLNNTLNHRRTFQIYLTTDGNKSYTFFIYDNQTYPRGGVVGINVGDGINFDLQASTMTENSDTIAQKTNAGFFRRLGLYFYKLNNLLHAVRCTNGEIRLVGINSKAHQGRVELCYNNVWSGVCYDSWDVNGANVACKLLGFYPTGNLPTCYPNPGTGVALFDDVQCNGTESSLLECAHSDTARCSCTHYAGVTCARRWTIPAKLDKSCPNDTSSFQEEIVQLLSSVYGVSLIGLSRQHPAQSCNQIHDANPSSNSGFYWIRSESMIQRQYCTF